jgi:hypothetical protein
MRVNSIGECMNVLLKSGKSWATKNCFDFYAAPMMLAAWLCALLALPMTVSAQVVVVPPLPAPQLLVTPLVGVVGEPRTLSVIGQWPDTCPPVAATLDDSLATAGKTVLIRLLVLPTSVKCPSGITPYRFEIPYAGREVGALNVLIFGAVLPINNNGKGSIITTAVAVPATATTAAVAFGHSAGDISGVWYDPATSGSGLSFTHAYAGSDAVFGTWFLYDSNGLPRWFSIQDAKWSGNGTVMEGKLLETSAAANSCLPDIVACPTNSTSLTNAGRIRATFVNIEVGSTKSPQAKVEAFSSTNVPLFSSNIIRAF